MSNTYAKTPWRIVTGGSIPGGGHCFIKGKDHGKGETVAYCKKGDARRAVLCVNACEGSSDDWLKGYGDGINTVTAAKSFQQNLKDLSNERDELLRTCKALLELVQSHTPLGADDALEKITETITRCEAS